MMSYLQHQSVWGRGDNGFNFVLAWALLAGAMSGLMAMVTCSIQLQASPDSSASSDHDHSVSQWGCGSESSDALWDLFCEEEEMSSDQPSQPSSLLPGVLLGGPPTLGVGSVMAASGTRATAALRGTKGVLRRHILQASPARTLSNRVMAGALAVSAAAWGLRSAYQRHRRDAIYGSSYQTVSSWSLSGRSSRPESVDPIHGGTASSLGASRARGMFSNSPLEDPERNEEDQEVLKRLLYMGERGPNYEKSVLLAIEERNYEDLRAKLTPDGGFLASGAQEEEDRMILRHSLRRIRDIHERQRVFRARKSLEQWREILKAHLIERVLMHRDYVTGASSQEQIDHQSVLSILPQDIFFSFDLDEQESEILESFRVADTWGPTLEKIYLSQLIEQWAQIEDERRSRKRATDRVFVHTLRFIRETQKRQWLYEKTGSREQWLDLLDSHILKRRMHEVSVKSLHSDHLPPHHIIHDRGKHEVLQEQDDEPLIALLASVPEPNSDYLSALPHLYRTDLTRLLEWSKRGHGGIQEEVEFLAELREHIAGYQTKLLEAQLQGKMETTKIQLQHDPMYHHTLFLAREIIERQQFYKASGFLQTWQSHLAKSIEYRRSYLSEHEDPPEGDLIMNR